MRNAEGGEYKGMASHLPDGGSGGGRVQERNLFPAGSDAVNIFLQKLHSWIPENRCKKKRAMIQ